MKELYCHPIAQLATCLFDKMLKSQSDRTASLAAHSNQRATDRVRACRCEMAGGQGLFIDSCISVYSTDNKELVAHG